MLLSLTNTHLNNKGDEFTTASDIEINASACEMRSVRIQSRHTWSPERVGFRPLTELAELRFQVLVGGCVRCTTSTVAR